MTRFLSYTITHDQIVADLVHYFDVCYETKKRMQQKLSPNQTHASKYAMQSLLDTVDRYLSFSR